MFTLSSQQAGELLRYARKQLLMHFGVIADTTISFSPELENFLFQKTNITLRRNSVLRASMSGKGATFPEAIADAIQKCVNDKRFLGSPIVAAELDKIHIELWIQVNEDRLNNSNLEEMKKIFNLGIHGIDIRRNERYAYYKPSVAITSRFNSLERLLERLCRKAKLNPNEWKENDAILNRTHWLHYAEPIHGSTEAIPLFRLRSRNKISINTETITQALRLTAKRLCASQRADGTYNYTYDAYKDIFDNEGFNMVRMAGCAYAVARTAACELTQDIQPLTEASAEKAIRFLLSISTPSPSSNDHIFIADGMKRRNRGKLGTSALTLLALQFGNFRTRFAEERKQISNLILSLQRTNGSLQCFIPDNPDPDKGKNFFPGEALLALCHELKQGNTHVQATIEKAFPYYHNHFQTNPSTAFILWQIDTWQRFYKIQEANNMPTAQLTAYSEFIFLMADWLLKHQYTEDNAPSKDYIGGFSLGKIPGTTSTVHTESIILACGIAKRLGLEEKINRYRQAARRGLEFTLRLQLTEKESFLFPQPALAIGGITGNINSLKIRNDHDQHAMTAFIAALETPSVIS
jgi:AMMECR1 domain-containing protein